MDKTTEAIIKELKYVYKQFRNLGLEDSKQAAIICGRIAKYYKQNCMYENADFWYKTEERLLKENYNA